MFDVAPTELLLVAIVALVVIGPKDLPKAMRFVGFWVGRARGVMRQFRSGFDTMVREAELEEMEKKWAEENARIMREHPATPAEPPSALPADPAVVEHDPAPVMTAQPVMLEKPADPDPVPIMEAEPAPSEPAEPTVPPVRKKRAPKKVQP